MREKEEQLPLNSKKSGRPLREFDKKIFEGLCHIHCTVNEIESIFHTDQRTIDKWCQREYGSDFSTVYKLYQSDGKASVRRDQFYHCKRSPAMAMFLGKVLLGQVDSPYMAKSPNDNPIERLIEGIKAYAKPAVMIETLKEENELHGT